MWEPGRVDAGLNGKCFAIAGILIGKLQVLVCITETTARCCNGRRERKNRHRDIGSNLHLGVEPSFCALELLIKVLVHMSVPMYCVQTEMITDGPFGSLFKPESSSPLMAW